MPGPDRKPPTNLARAIARLRQASDHPRGTALDQYHELWAAIADVLAAPSPPDLLVVDDPHHVQPFDLVHTDQGAMYVHRIRWSDGDCEIDVAPCEIVEDVVEGVTVVNPVWHYDRGRTYKRGWEGTRYRNDLPLYIVRGAPLGRALDVGPKILVHPENITGIHQRVEENPDA